MRASAVAGRRLSHSDPGPPVCWCRSWDRSHSAAAECVCRATSWAPISHCGCILDPQRTLLSALSTPCHALKQDHSTARGLSLLCSHACCRCEDVTKPLLSDLGEWAERTWPPTRSEHECAALYRHLPHLLEHALSDVSPFVRHGGQALSERTSCWLNLSLLYTLPWLFYLPTEICIIAIYACYKSPVTLQYA